MKYVSKGFGSPARRFGAALAEKRQAAFEAYRADCYESGEVPCIDVGHHAYVVSDEDDDYAYCEKCGCGEY